MKSFVLALLCISSSIVLAHDTTAYNLAKESFIKKEKLKALDMCNDILSKDKQYVDAYVLRGGLYLDLGLPIDALEDFNSAINIDPDCFPAYLGRAMYYNQNDNFNEALADLNKAELINDSALILYLNKSHLYNQLHLYDLNIQQLSKGIQKHPKSLLLYQSRCYVYICKNKIDSAIMDAFATLKIDSTDITAKTNLGFCYILLKQYKKANDIYTKLNITSESHPYMLSNYGFVQYKMGKKIEGLDNIYRSLKILENNAFAHRYLAEISIEEKDLESACYHINKSLKLGYTNEYGNYVELMQKKYCQ
jgi:tetratricopeptide (TPR) repeat protein